MTIKVMKITMNKEVIMENGELTGIDLFDVESTAKDVSPEYYKRQASQRRTLSLSFYLNVGKKMFRRNCFMELGRFDREYDLKKKYVAKMTFYELSIKIKPAEYEPHIKKKIKELEKSFFMTETEMLESIKYMLETKNNNVFFRTQVEIGKRIIDGLAFVKGDYADDRYEILGFEVKTDKDNYSRLPGQVDAYFNICDKVYLVVENKYHPKNLPWNVGVIRIGDDVEIEREAVTLKHDVEINECWSTLLKAFNAELGLKKRAPIKEFFQTVLNIKKKLLWNQFVIGFHQTYVKEYIQLNDKEKSIIRHFFGKQEGLQRWLK